MTWFKTVPQTGNLGIDGLLEGSAYDTLSLGYAFIQDAKDVPLADDAPKFSPLAAFGQTLVLNAMAQVESFTGITFHEDSQQTSVIAIMELDMKNALGSSGFPDYLPSMNSYGRNSIYFDFMRATGGETDPSKIDPHTMAVMFRAAMHELGHNLGLKHTFDPSSAYGNYTVDVVYPEDMDNTSYSVMAYRVGMETATYTANDVAALQYLYGANYAFRSDDTVYKFTAVKGNESIWGDGKHTFDMTGTVTVDDVVYNYGTDTSVNFWDGGGNDTYDFSGSDIAVVASIEPGERSGFGDKFRDRYVDSNFGYHDTPDMISNSYLFQDDTRSIIENLVGSRFSDVLHGNQVANLITGGDGSDSIDGGDGVDTAAFSGKSGNYRVTMNSDGSYLVADRKGSGGQDTLVSVEKLSFADGTFAIDDLVDSNGAPVVNHPIDGQSATAGKAFSFTFASDTFTDPDNDTLVYTAAASGGGSMPSWLSFDAASRTFSGTPPAGFSGSVSIAVQASDGHASVSTTLIISVGGGNHAPVAHDDAGTLYENATASFDVLSNDTDADGDAISVTSAHVASGSGAVKLNRDGSLLVDYTGQDLKPGQHASLVISYTVGDGTADDGGSLVIDVIGQSGPGRAIVGTPSDDTLQGTRRGETISGLGGRDTILGKGGRDAIDGGAGNDVLTGGGGKDVFVFGNRCGHDEITDFSFGGHDRIDLSGVSGIENYRDLVRHHASAHDNDLVITINGDDSILFDGYHPNQMSKSDFIF